jgi:hypothetical protein
MFAFSCTPHAGVRRADPRRDRHGDPSDVAKTSPRRKLCACASPAPSILGNYPSSRSDRRAKGETMHTHRRGFVFTPLFLALSRAVAS